MTLTLGNHTFQVSALLQQALTHKSVEQVPHYERLEFLGDRVLNLAVAELLFKTYPEEQEGLLAKRYAALVRTETLAEIAREEEIPPLIVMSEGEARTGGREKDSILADVMEALLAVAFLENGMSAVQKVIDTLWRPRLDMVTMQDAKSHLQEFLQGQHEALPSYTVVATSGKDHDRTFTVEVACRLGTAVGEGTSKQGAGQAAAQALLETLKQR